MEFSLGEICESLKVRLVAPKKGVGVRQSSLLLAMNPVKRGDQEHATESTEGRVG